MATTPAPRPVASLRGQQSEDARWVFAYAAVWRIDSSSGGCSCAVRSSERSGPHAPEDKCREEEVAASTMKETLRPERHRHSTADSGANGQHRPQVEPMRTFAADSSCARRYSASAAWAAVRSRPSRWRLGSRRRRRTAASAGGRASSGSSRLRCASGRRRSSAFRRSALSTSWPANGGARKDRQ